jgi:hypothetical protein
MYMANKFDKPHRQVIKFDEKKIIDLFIRINNMNTHEIKQFSLMEQIPLTVNDNEGNNLIHKVLLSDDKIKTEYMRLNMIKFLYTENVNPNSPNMMNVTPLHIACGKQYDTIITYLLEIGVDPNYQDNNGSTPFHRLLGGKIQLEENDKNERGLIVPKQKKLDREYIKLWYEERSRMWTAIKDSPYLAAIEATMKDTIHTPEVVNIIKDFQEELFILNTKDSGVLKLDMMKELKNLRNISIKQFKDHIETKWGKFQSIEMKVHPSEPNSWPQGGLSIIKNANPDNYIKDKIDESINFGENIEKLDDIDVDSIYNTIKDNFDTNPIDYNQPNDSMDSYYAKYKHKNAIDFASDIIDWTNYTFLGGSRQVIITNEMSIAQITSLSQYPIEKIVYCMAYGLFFSNFNGIAAHYEPSLIGLGRTQGQFDYAQLNPLENKVIEFIVKYILDTLTREEEELIVLIQANPNYNYLHKLINIKSTSNKISWLYTFMTTFMSIHFNQNTNLIVNINQISMYLISGYANYTSDLRLSIMQVLKSHHISAINNMNGFGYHNLINLNNYDLGSIYGSWIYMLLTENTDNIMINNNINRHNNDKDAIFNHIDTFTINGGPENINLITIIKYTYNFFNLIPNPIDTTNMSEGERLCAMIVKYYNEMNQKPLLQNIVDTLNLIRFREINKMNDIIRNRILTLYEAPLPSQNLIRNANLNTMHRIDQNLPTILNSIKQNQTNEFKFFNLFNIRDTSIEMFLLTEYALPSKIFYYLSRGFKYIDQFDLTKNTPNDEPFHYLLKKIEASHLGLCFMGLLPAINIPHTNPHPYLTTGTSVGPIPKDTKIGPDAIIPPGLIIPNEMIWPVGDVLPANFSLQPLINSTPVPGTGIIFPPGTNIVGGMIWPLNTDLPINFSIPVPLPNVTPVDRTGIIFPPGTIIPVGFFDPGGIIWPPGESLPPGFNIPVAVINPTQVPGTGIIFPPGTIIPLGTYIPVGTFIAPGVIWPPNKNLPVDFKIPSPQSTPTSVQDIIFPPRTVIPQTIKWPKDAVLPAGYVLASQPIETVINTIIFPPGTVIPGGFVDPGGIIWPYGCNLPPVFSIPVALLTETRINGIIFPPGTVIPVGTIIPIGTYIPGLIWDENLPIGFSIPNPLLYPIKVPGKTIIFPPGTVIPVGTILQDGNRLRPGLTNSIISQGTIIDGSNFNQGTIFPLGTIIEPGCNFPKGTVLPLGTFIPKGITLNITKTIIINTNPSLLKQLNLPPNALPPGTILKRGFKFAEGSELIRGTVFTLGSILDPNTVIECPSPIITPDNSFYSMFYYFNQFNSPLRDRPYFSTNEINTLFRPPTTFSYYYIVKLLQDKMIDMRNKINKVVTKIMKDFQLTKRSSKYGGILICYAVLNSIDTIHTSIDVRYKDEDNVDWDKEVYSKIQKIKSTIKEFENSINTINGYNFLYYYLKGAKIPKFFQYKFGEKFQFSYDNTDIVYPSNQPLPIQPNIPVYDKLGSFEQSSYKNVIQSILDGKYYIATIVNREYPGRQNEILPLDSILPEFYKLNTIQLIVNTQIYNLDHLIRDTYINSDMVTIQSYRIGAQMIEDLVKLYMKNKISELGLLLYNQLIGNNRKLLPKDLELERLDDKYNFDVDINKLPSNEILYNVMRRRIETKILLNFYPFTDMKEINKFYIYPNDYNSTNLLASKYSIDINLNIIDTMITKGANVFIHNNEMSSPLNQLIKSTHFQAIERIKANGINVDSYKSYKSPYKYLFEQYKSHTEKFIQGDLVTSIKKFVEPQYNEIFNIIQSSDQYNNNILLNLELSFSICNYLTQQFLTENIVRYSNKFDIRLATYLIDFEIPHYMIAGTGLYYMKNINRLNISSKNEGTLLEIIIDNYKKDLDLIENKLVEYNREKGLYTVKGLFNSSIDRKIAARTIEKNKIERDKIRIMKIKNNIPPITIPNNTRPEPRIIKRYNAFIRNIPRGSYIEGWNRLIFENSPDLMIGRIIQDEYNNIQRKKSIEEIDLGYLEYYEQLSIISKSYFEKPHYMSKNKVLRFVYDLLVHLTQNILCHSIELIIRKILYQSLENDYLERIIGFTKIINRIDYIITDELKEYLYGEVAEKFVRNSISCYEDIEDKESYEVQTVADILNQFLDFMETNSPIEIHKNTMSILKNNIVPYFDTIIGKTINNWNVVSENMFLFCINQYRLIKSISASI